MTRNLEDEFDALKSDVKELTDAVKQLSEEIGSRSTRVRKMDEDGSRSIVRSTYNRCPFSRGSPWHYSLICFHLTCNYHSYHGGTTVCDIRPLVNAFFDRSCVRLGASRVYGYQKMADSAVFNAY
jgi:hypothetical protein